MDEVEGVREAGQEMSQAGTPQRFKLKGGKLPAEATIQLLHLTGLSEEHFFKRAVASKGRQGIPQRQCDKGRRREQATDVMFTGLKLRTKGPQVTVNPEQDPLKQSIPELVCAVKVFNKDNQDTSKWKE
ncbi:MAG: hypothetical protein Q9157_004990 [Trypethelium eluteriae]